jgi:hypothetical protein
VISKLAKFFLMVLRRVIAGCVIAALGLAAWAGWLCRNDDGDFSRRRARELASLAAECKQAAASDTEAGRRAGAITAELDAQQQRVAEAERAIELHKSIESGWRRWTGGREEQVLNDRKREEQEKTKAEALERIAALKQELAGVMLARQRGEIALARLDRRITAMETATSGGGFYARLVWDGRNGGRWAFWFVAIWVVWPVPWRFWLYYFVAPFVIRRKPLRLSKNAGGAPVSGDGGDGGKVVTVGLRPGELLCVKPGLVESADAELARRGRFWLKARFPVMNIACGLVRMAELRNGHAAGTVRRVVLRDATGCGVVLHDAGEWKDRGRDVCDVRDVRDVREECDVRERGDVCGRGDGLAVVEVPGGGSLVLRPRYLAGVAHAIDAPLVIRSHWRFLSWHAWVTGQFRFFEFAGPCRLIVACERGVQIETIGPRDDGRRPVRRVSAGATICFTPGLRYRPARTESFWSYCRGLSPLYDDLFIGEGMFFVQKAAPGRECCGKGLARRFFAGVWRGVQRIFGM